MKQIKSCRSVKIKEVMTKNPTVVSKEMLAAEAMRILQEKKIDEIPVVDKNKRPVGLIGCAGFIKGRVGIDNGSNAELLEKAKKD